jgi:hypothetical protein
VRSTSLSESFIYDSTLLTINRNRSSTIQIFRLVANRLSRSTERGTNNTQSQVQTSPILSHCVPRKNLNLDEFKKLSRVSRSRLSQAVVFWTSSALLYVHEKYIESATDNVYGLYPILRHHWVAFKQRLNWSDSRKDPNVISEIWLH